MTDINHTLNDEMILAACKHYIRITDTNERQLVAEIFELASQYCDNMKVEMLNKYGEEPEL